jgi:hypothetical protein
MIKDCLRASRLALGYWPLTLSAFAIHSLFGLSTLTEPLLDNDATTGLMIPCLIGLMVINYLMSRRAGAPKPNEIGSVGRYLGWGLLAGLPLIAIALSYATVIGFETWSNSAQPFWIESALFVIAAVIALPLYALSTGRAINGEGPSASLIFAYCKQNIVPIITSGVALLLVPNFLSDFLLYGSGVDSPTQALSVLLGVAGGLAMLAVSLATIGLSATIYRNAEKMTAPSRTS